VFRFIAAVLGGCCATLALAEPTAAELAATTSAPSAEPIPGLQPNWDTGGPKSTANFFRRSPEPGLFAEVDGVLHFPNFHGQRVAVPGFTPLAPGHYPTLNIGGANQFNYSSGDSNGNNDWSNGVGGLDLLLGYRFEAGAGEVMLGFRGLTGDGQRFLANGDPLSGAYQAALLGSTIGDIPVTDASLQYPEKGKLDPFGAALTGTSLGGYALDLTYGNGYYGLPWADVQWSAGGRLGSMTSYDVIRSRGIESRVDNRFLGAGPAGSLGVEWNVFGWRNDSPWDVTLLTRVDGSFLRGSARQTDGEVMSSPYPFSYRYGTFQETRTVPTFGFEVALAIRDYSPRSCFLIGYRFETWKGVGRVAGSAWDLNLHGLFVGYRGNY
jgi:hypothetical protein